MPEASFFTDMLQSITDHGRQLLFSGSRNTRAAAKADLQTLCEMLLSSRGEASGIALAAEILDRWGALDRFQRYALAKLSRNTDKVNHDFLPAMKEFGLVD